MEAEATRSFSVNLETNMCGSLFVCPSGGRLVTSAAKHINYARSDKPTAAEAGGR